MQINSDLLPKNKTKSVESLLKDVLYPNGFLFLYVQNNYYTIIRDNQKQGGEQTDTYWRVISGQVKGSNGQPLTGVTVMPDGIGVRTGVSTSSDGSYTLRLREPAEAIVFSFIGMEPQRRVIGKNSQINVSMGDAVNQLEEVQVLSTGYQKISKERATGSFSQITSKELKEVPSVNLMERIEGMVPGMQVDLRNNRIQIRGVNSFGTDSDPLGNSKKPLIVIDGFPAMDQELTETSTTYANNSVLSRFNPEDIESITVLKDAAAASIWGAQAANGVIVIETKKGKNQPPSISFSSSLSTSAPADLNKLSRMSSKDYVDLERELFNLGGISDPSAWTPGGWSQFNQNAPVSETMQWLFKNKKGEIDNNTLEEQLNRLGNSNNVGQIRDNLFQNAVSQQYNVSLSGGNNRSTYLISMNYSDDVPVFKKNRGQGYFINSNFTTNFLDQRLNLTTGINYVYSKSTSNQVAANTIGSGQFGYRPYEQLLDENGQQIKRSLRFTDNNSDGVLKVMRSYQYYAANAISNRVATTDWKQPDTRGGFVWHTTGSGKTMTSFKSAQLIATSKDADKVVFLMDRIELGVQSLREYRSFADDSQSVQATEDTQVLINKLKSDDPADTLIVTSIQKMSNIESDESGMYAKDLELMRSKRMVIIIDEAHRSVFGDMLLEIKALFPKAVLFGFTGTPIQKENSRKDTDTSTIFGHELHRYSLADGIRDKNVLGFDPYKVMTYRDIDIRRAVALQEAKAIDETEAISDAKKSEIYYKFMDTSQVKMAGDYNSAGEYVRGVEDYLASVQYDRDEHRNAVVADIKENWVRLSRASQFHAIFATSSITEAITYYELFKQEFPSLKVSALFDPHIDNNEGFEFKEEGLKLIIGDYNARYNRNFTIPTHHLFKKDLANRIAHKKPFERIHNNPDEQLDLLIVVDQMLTGFDSKWVNTLYLDKKLEYENIIQAFSRTNRLFGMGKPFGNIRYYRLPHTMERNIDRAVKLYSGDRPFGLFVDHLDENLNRINYLFSEITLLFGHAGVESFTRLPDGLDERGQFSKLFRNLTQVLESAKIQGFLWNKQQYEFIKQVGQPKEIIAVLLDEMTYNTLLMRYKELFTELPDVEPGARR